MNSPKYQIIKIESDYDLLRTLECLKNGMQMNNIWANKLSKFILKKNKKQSFYGFAIEKNEKIYGGILTILQGTYEDSLSSPRKIYNLSTYYVEKSLRGIAPIALIRKLIKDLEGCILTNYTASDEVRAILKSFGFKYMESFDYRKSSLNISTLFNSGNRNIETIKTINHINSDSFKINFSKTNSLVTLKINPFNLKIIGIITHKKINVIKLPYFMILWSSDNCYLLNNLKKIQNYLFFKYFCLGIQIFPEKIDNLEKLKGKLRKTNFLLKSPIKVDYITPVGSEIEGIYGISKI